LVCLMLPWLNPFTSAPSTSVIPLLLSWMLVACALLLVVDEEPAQTILSATGRSLPPTRIFSRSLHTVFENKWGLILLMWFLVSALTVPDVIDRALTAGVLAAITCIWISMQIGKRVANRDNRLLSWILASWLIAGLISCIFALLQRFNLAYFMAPWINQSPSGIGFANLRQQNQFATLTSIGLVALFGLVAVSPKICRFYKLAVWASLVLLSAGLASSSSRTGALQWIFICALHFVTVLKDRNRHHAFQIHLALSGLPFLILWSFAFPWFASLFNHSMGASVLFRLVNSAYNFADCGGRIVLWSNVIEMMAKYPWHGWGLGETDYAYFATDYRGERFCDLLDNAHNLPLHLALELGIPFAVVFCACVTVWILKCLALRPLTNERLIAFGVLSVIGVHSMLEYPLWYGPFQISLGLALGLMATKEAAPKVKGSKNAQLLAILLSAALFLICLYAAWDFNRVAQIFKDPELRDAEYRNNPIQKASQTWVFKNQIDFALLMTQTITKENAQSNYDLAIRLLHYSPEPRVTQRAIECLVLLGRVQDAERLSTRIATTAKNQ
jgi:hypothetical protein